MFPGTYVGLLLLVVSVCPGYWWTRVAEARKPRRDRTQLLEAAELLSIGAISSSVALVATALVEHAAGFIRIDGLVASPGHYAHQHPIAIAAGIFAALVASNFGTWLAAKLTYRRYGREVVHESAFFRLFNTTAKGTRAYITVERTDGAAVAGWFFLCTAQPCPPEEQELALARVAESRIHFRASGASCFVPIDDQCVVVPGHMIRGTYVTYGLAPEAGEDAITDRDSGLFHRALRPLIAIVRSRKPAASQPRSRRPKPPRISERT